MAKTKRVPLTTNNITEGIVNTILLAGYSASRINTQGQYIEDLNGVDDFGRKKGGYRPSGSRKGFADIDCCIAGRAVVIEVKNEATRDSAKKHQKVFQAEWVAAGGIYFVCINWMQFLAWWDYMLAKVIPAWKQADLLYAQWLDQQTPSPCADGCDDILIEHHPPNEPAKGRCKKCGVALTSDDLKIIYQHGLPLHRHRKQ